jgi:tellurite resistance protein TerC
MTSVGSIWHWVGFLALVLFLLSLDLFVFQRKSHVVSAKEALSWSGFWILLAIGFGGLVYKWFGARLAMEYYAGYVIEKALSVDNLFVFLVIFGYFRVPKELQHRVLYWGILGALVLRAVFILAGAALVQKFHFVLYFFGAFLVFTGVKLFLGDDKEGDAGESFVIRTIQKWIPTTSDYRGNSFFVREGSRWLATPLFLVLIVIETTDLVFAVDSIPAIFGISRDPFIIFSSNIFAILGLSSR